MNPFSRSATIASGWRPAPPMEVSGDLSSWQPPTYPLVGFDAATFMSTNKVAIALGLGVIAGLVAYKYGYR